MILTPLASFWASAERLLPPMMRPYVCTWWVISSFSTPYVCMANSRVGDNMTTPVPDTHTHQSHVTPLRSYLHLCYDYNNQRMTICTLTISGHKFEFVDKLDGGNQESQSFTASCFSCSQHVSVVQEWAHISNIYTTNKQMWWLLYHRNPTKSDALQTHLPSRRGRMVLCWISVMVSKPISITPFSVFSLTTSAKDANDLSSNAPEKVTSEEIK